ncbi:hypothetical protein [Rickettsia hoogstraalii]|uniref:hypothetical protein n=1 Tax=Rickettsia hoogstraalii TaxID=467174 RepID=UPI000A6C910F|nr:hypothetical protein [Rickettsia hoogstraalii]
MLPTALDVDLNSLVEIKEIINAEERKKKEQLKADIKLSQDIATPSDNIFNKDTQDTQISPQKLSTSSHNWLNTSSFQPFGSSPQDTPSPAAINDIESNEMSSKPNSIEELQSRSSSSSQDSSSSEKELVFNRNNIIFDLSSSNTNTDKIKRDNDDVKNSKNELLSSSIEEELVF